MRASSNLAHPRRSHLDPADIAVDRAQLDGDDADLSGSALHGRPVLTAALLVDSRDVTDASESR